MKRLWLLGHKKDEERRDDILVLPTQLAPKKNKSEFSPKQTIKTRGKSTKKGA
jgi:hypothetical protein